MKHHNKLVRDRILEILESKNIPYQSRILSEAEFRMELFRKVVEEANEVFSAKDKAELKTEIADLLEVIESIMFTQGLTWQEIVKVKQERRDSRGAFDKKIFLESTNE